LSNSGLWKKKKFKKNSEKISKKVPKGPKPRKPEKRWMDGFPLGELLNLGQMLFPTVQ
jgi:hypothetical protein